MSVCRSCKAPIVWITMRSGMRMPVNPEYVTIAVVNGPNDTDATVHQGRVSHFATCPNAEQHRRRP